MTPRLTAFVALAVVLAAVFIRLGFWQLDRRTERRELNAAMLRQLSLAPVAITSLADSNAANRRATVEGTPDYEHEIRVTGRSRNGSPGVHILTPVRLDGRDTAVLVNRGWVYSPDAATVDLTRWRETRSSFSGYTQLLPPGDTTSIPSRNRGVRQLSHAAVARLVPYPVSRVYLVARDSATANADSTPARLDSPLPGDGPHLSYAIQWFAFAAIALGGAVAVVMRARKSAGA